MDSEILYTKVLVENLDEFSQWRLVINRFRGVEYLQIRKYFLTFDGDYQPTKDGVNIPLSLLLATNLSLGLADILAEAELTEAIKAASKLYRQEVQQQLIELLKEND